MDIPYTVERREDTGLYNAKLGVWLFLASEVMLFGALFSSYILLRVGADPGTWPRHWLNYKLGAVNTIVLIVSSVSNVIAWANLKIGSLQAVPVLSGHHHRLRHRLPGDQVLRVLRQIPSLHDHIEGWPHRRRPHSKE